MSDSVRPHRWQPTRLPCPWDSLGKNTGVGCHFLLQCMEVKSQSEVAQSCPTLSDPMDCSLPGSSVHGIFQARVLEWVAISFSRGYSRPMTWTLPHCRQTLIWATREVHQSEWPSSKSPQTKNTGQGVEKMEPSYTVGGNANWYSHYGEERGNSLKNWE